MRIKPYTCDNGGSGMIWLLPAIVVSTGPAAFKHRRKIFDVAFHWITFGFGLCFEWGRRSPGDQQRDMNKESGS